MSRPQAMFDTQIFDARVIVTEWRFAAGAETGWHRHEYDYVVVPLTGGELLLETKQGEKIAQLDPGQAYFRMAGVEHNVINNSDHEIVFIETEIR